MDFFHPFRQKLIKMTFNLIDKHANEGNYLLWKNLLRTLKIYVAF